MACHRESFRTQDVTSVAPPPLGFTGKEADEEVGVVYFGERYLISRLGRWATPDPAEIHALSGGDVLNFYHYVQGNILQARDPLGLSAETREVRGQIEYRLPSDKWTASTKEFASAWIKEGIIKTFEAEFQGFADLLNISADDLKALVDAVKANPFGFAKDVIGGVVGDLRDALGDAYTAAVSDRGGAKGYQALGRLAAKGAIAVAGAATGGAGGAAKLATKGAGVLGKGAREAVEKVADAMKVGKKRGPKPHGEGAHNKKVAEISDRLEAEGNVIIAGGQRKREAIVPTPGGAKNTRRPDTIYMTPDKELKGVQVGRTNAKGDPVRREVRALDDLNGSGGLPTTFEAYDRD